MVEDGTLEKLQAIAEAQAPVDVAEESFNGALLNLAALRMTLSEVQQMGVDTTTLDDAVSASVDAVQSAAKALATARITSLGPIGAAKQALRTQLSGIESYPESPVDYNKTQIKQMPLSADSLKLDSQYFSFDEESQDSSSHAGTIQSYVSSTTSFLGDSYSSQISGAVQQQVQSQHDHHDLQGTLVITATCSHKNAAILAPFILDVDKGIKVWNELFPTALIKTNSLESMAKIAEDQQTEKASRFHILSGATYGSSFVGMVHVLRTEDTQVSQSMTSVAASLQEQMKVGGWFVDEEGGFGVSSTFADDAKNLLSSQAISSHISVVTMGSIPSVKSNNVKVGVKQFADFDPAAMMNKLATLQASTNADQASVDQAAAAARTGGQMMAIRGGEIAQVMSSVGALDDGQNKMLDINSLMTAFEDYVDKALAGNVGVPITYYLKSITAADLAQMWVAKYFPNKYVTATADDTTPAEPPAGGSTPAPAPAPAPPAGG